MQTMIRYIDMHLTLEQKGVTKSMGVRFVDAIGHFIFQLPQHVPEHHAQDDVGPESEVTRKDALVKPSDSFLFERLGQAFQVRRIQKTTAFGVHTC